MYEVSWTDTSLEGLAELAVLYQDRWADINGAVDLIEYRLQRKPLAYSAEVSEGLRRIDVQPVAVCFSISGTSLTVESIGWAG